jgi:hypothetical protein
MRRMRLPYLRKAAPEVLATARAQRWDPPRCCGCCLPPPLTAARFGMAASGQTDPVPAQLPDVVCPKYVACS